MLVVAGLAAGALFFYNVVVTILIIADARGHGWLAGWLSSLSWIPNITGTAVAVTALQGHSLSTKAAVFGAVFVANLFGTKLGQTLGQRFVHDDKIDSRLAALEAAATNRIKEGRSEERRVGKECRSRWSPY